MKPLRLFYVLFAYILLFSVWWMYLLYDKNRTAFTEQTEILRLTAAEGTDFEKSNTFRETQLRYNRQKLMIFTEGSVFLILLLIGLWKVRKVLKAEIKLSEQQKNFILSITHEFKSPLASIRLTQQTLLRKNKENPSTTELLNRSLQDVDRLGSLVENMLLSAKIEQDRYGFRSEPINFSELVDEAIGKYRNFKQQLEIKSQIAADLWIEADYTAAWSMVGNLIENACKYSGDPAIVEVVLLEEEGRLILQVKDNGKGIPEEERSKVFQKFYRTGSEQTRTAKGTGLGLFIVGQLAEIYRGAVDVSPNHPQGTVFTLKLPVLAKPETILNVS